MKISFSSRKGNEENAKKGSELKLTRLYNTLSYYDREDLDENSGDQSGI